MTITTAPYGIYSLGIGFNEVTQATFHKRQHKQKKLIGVTRSLFSLQQLFVGENISIALTITGIVSGAAILGVSVIAGLSIAATMWGATAIACYDAIKAEKKQDMEYLAHDRLIKYQNISNRIKKLEEKAQKIANM